MISCQGGTATARLAAEVAGALEQLDVAEAAPELDGAVTAARGGRKLVALDGCRSACCSRVLAAKGLKPHTALNLADLSASVRAPDAENPARLAVEAASRLRSRRPARPTTRPPRPAAPAAAPRAKRAHTVDDYLLAMDDLAAATVECGALAAHSPTLAAHVSRLLGVSRASAGEVLARLEAAGLVERGARKELLLTSSGRVAADRAVRRHRLLERLASDFLGYPPAECYERARMLDDAFDEEAVERVRRALGDPERCPHGWPVDPRRAREESVELITLAALGPGRAAVVVRLAEHDGPLLGRLYALGLAPGARLTVRGRSPDRVSVRVGRSLRRLDRAAAEQVFVLG